MGDEHHGSVHGVAGIFGEEAWVGEEVGQIRQTADVGIAHDGVPIVVVEAVVQAAGVNQNNGEEQKRWVETGRQR